AKVANPLDERRHGPHRHGSILHDRFYVRNPERLQCLVVTGREEDGSIAQSARELCAERFVRRNEQNSSHSVTVVSSVADDPLLSLTSPRTFKHNAAIILCN